MASDVGDNVKALVEVVSCRGLDVGVDLCRRIQTDTEVFLDWLNHLRKSEATGVADALLDGAQGAIVETAGCLALGLVRSALSSLRSEIDMALSWLYFKDHKVEWDRLRDTGRGFQTKAQVLKYAEDHWPMFKTRFKLLEQQKNRGEHDPYRLLSAHIHGQTDFTTPRVGPLVELVAEARLCDECVTLQRDVTEYVCDVLLAVYGDRWASLPDTVRAGFESRLDAGQRRAFFPGNPS